MEFLIAKAFELESREDKPVFVTYPYGVREQHNMELEQIDGAVHVNGLHALIECKDYKDSNIEIFQKEVLLKLKDGVAFLQRHLPSYYEEVLQRYSDIMKNIIFQIFNEYCSSFSFLYVVHFIDYENNRLNWHLLKN